MTQDLPLEGPHWSFALRLYSRAGVSEACLTLQDQLGVDVNVLLFALFAAVSRGVPLDNGDIADMDLTVAAWRSGIVEPLRSLRHLMKNGPEPAPSGVTERLRQQIKQAELSAEQIEQAVLFRWLDQRCGNQLALKVDSAAVIESVVRYFGKRNGEAEAVVSSQAQHAIRTIARAATSMRVF